VYYRSKDRSIHW